MPPPVFTPKKSLGQHFLHDPNVARKIVALLSPEPGDPVLEIGPGDGALTSVLASSGALVTALDVDRRAVDALQRMREERGWERVRIEHGDVLTYDLGALAERSGARIRVLGNLPYYITSQILLRLFDAGGQVRDAVLMMQREVADRLLSPPGSKAYGILSVYTAVHGCIVDTFLVSPNVFTPKPKVWSRVIRLEFRDELRQGILSLEDFRRIVRGAFGTRRKTLQNALRNVGVDTGMFDGALASLLPKRPEMLAPEDFIALANVYTRSAISSRRQPEDERTASASTPSQPDRDTAHR